MVGTLGVVLIVILSTGSFPGHTLDIISLIRKSN